MAVADGIYNILCRLHAKLCSDEEPFEPVQSIDYEPLKDLNALRRWDIANAPKVPRGRGKM